MAWSTLPCQSPKLPTMSFLSVTSVSLCGNSVKLCNVNLVTFSNNAIVILHFVGHLSDELKLCLPPFVAVFHGLVVHHWCSVSVSDVHVFWLSCVWSVWNSVPFYVRSVGTHWESDKHTTLSWFYSFLNWN